MKPVRFRGLLAVLLSLLLLLTILSGCQNRSAQFESLVEQSDFAGALELYGKSIISKARLKDESNTFLTNHFAAKWEAFLKGELTDEDFSVIYEGIKAITEPHQIIPLFAEYSDQYEAIKRFKALYEEGLAFIEDNSLLQAIETLLQIEPIEGAPYQAAQDLIEELRQRYREQVLEEASELIQNEKVEEAIQVIEKAIVDVGEHASFSEALEDALQLYRESVLAAASQLIRDEDDDEAMRVIEAAVAKTGEHESFSQSLQEIFAHVLKNEVFGFYDAGDYLSAFSSYVDAHLHPYFTEDPALEEQALLARQAFIDETIEQAKETLGEKHNYVDAIKLINLAIAAVGEDPLLMQEFSYYESFKPVLLATLDYAAQDGDFYQLDYVEDSLAASYTNAFYANDAETSKDHRRTIVLDGQYTKMTGRVIVGHADRNKEDIGEISFYGDGELLFTSGPMGAGVEPIDFTIDLSEVQELEIVATSIADGWGGDHPFLVDTYVYRH